MNKEIEKEFYAILDILKERDWCIWGGTNDLDHFFEKINWYYLLKHMTISDNLIRFILEDAEGTITTYWSISTKLFYLSQNNNIPFSLKYKYMLEYGLIEKESKNHFIEYSKINNKTKDLIDFIDTI